MGYVSSLEGILFVDLHNVTVYHQVNLEKGRFWNFVNQIDSQVKSVTDKVAGKIPPTLPETNIAPENRPLEKGDSYGKPSFMGAMLVLGSVYLKFFDFRIAKRAWNVQICDR